MKLYKRKYGNRSIRGINDGYQGDYSLTKNDKALTREQVSQVKEYAISLGMPPERIRYAGHYYTSYGSNFDMLYIGYDVMPNPSPKSANSRITAKGSIAHEIVGHRESCLKHLDQSDPLLDEIQASIRAARFAPDLSNVERITLLRDAGERAKKQGITLKSVKNSLNISEEQNEHTSSNK